MTKEKQIGLAVVGAAGRMGKEIIRAAADRTDVRLVAALEHRDCDGVGEDAGKLAGTEPCGVFISADLAAGFDNADVVIDLSSTSATLPVLKAAIEKSVPLLCGTTGLDDDALAAFEEATANIPVLHTPNLSLGIALTNKLVAEGVGAMGSDWDIEILEMHHRGKVDAPSGTAMVLAETVAEARGVDLKTEGRWGRHGRTGARSPCEIGVHAIRGGGVFGWHKIIFAGPHETIEISHRASSRTLFAEGALRAALFLSGKPPARYTMTDVISAA